MPAEPSIEAAPSGVVHARPAAGPERLLPADATLLELGSGRLLVSPGHAIFCRIPAAEVALVERVLAGTAEPQILPVALRAELERHGFGGPPRASKPPSPSVQIQLTNACNLACSYCCTNSGSARSREVDRDRLLGVIEDVRRVLGPGTRVALLGGEPLLVPWALELAERIVDRELRLTLFTNGSLLDDDAIAARLAELVRRGAEVRVSLAGPDHELCDRMSGSPRFERAVAGINNLARFGGRAVVDLMLFPQHVDEVATAMPALRKLLPEGTRIALGVLYLSGRERGEHLFASRSALEASLDRIAFEGGETIAATAPSPLAERREGCTCALGHHLHVRSDGALFTCFKMEERVGDLATQSFAEALAALHAQARPVHTLPRCMGCPLATLCGGGCRSENLQYSGDADEPVCGPWRLRVLAELLAEDHGSALEWPATHLLAEARARGIEGPRELVPIRPSRHLLDT